MTGKKLIERYKSLVKGFEADDDSTDILEEMIDNAFEEIRNEFVSDVVRVGIEEKWLVKALDHLHDVQCPKVQYTGMQEGMADEAISNMKLSVYAAIEALEKGNKHYFKPLEMIVN